MGGAIDVTLTEVEVGVLRAVASEMRGVLAEPREFGFTARLFPPAYLDDPEAQAEYARLMTDELAQGKRDALASFEATLGRGGIRRGGWRVRLSADEAQAWLAVLNDARLTVGTRLDVTEETYERELDPGDPSTPAHEVFRYLGYLEDYLVQTIMR
jgi:hypothetical protein